MILTCWQALHNSPKLFGLTNLFILYSAQLIKSEWECLSLASHKAPLYSVWLHIIEVQEPKLVLDMFWEALLKIYKPSLIPIR